MVMLKKMVVTIFCLAVMVTLGCKQKAVFDGDGVKVVSTIGMIHDVVLNVGGRHVSAVSLMGPGVDPHLYKASEGDIRRLKQADIIFYNGLHLEAKLAEILEKMASRRPVIQVTQTLSEDRLLTPPEFKGLSDPHVWFDVLIWKETVNVVRDALIQQDPTHKADYTKQALAFSLQLEALHQEVMALSQSLSKEQRVLVTAHDAFNYFGRAYSFEVLGLQGISTESQAGVKDVQKLAQYIVDRQIPAIFVESSVPKRTIEAVQAAVKSKGFDVAIGGELFSDAMGEFGTVEGTYMGMIQHNMQAIVSALKGEKHD